MAAETNPSWGLFLNDVTKTELNKISKRQQIISATRLGNLLPFGLLFEPFGNQYFALATWQFGYFLGYFWKIVKKTCLNRFLA